MAELKKKRTFNATVADESFPSSGYDHDPCVAADVRLMRASNRCTSCHIYCTFLALVVLLGGALVLAALMLTSEAGGATTGRGVNKTTATGKATLSRTPEGRATTPTTSILNTKVAGASEATTPTVPKEAITLAQAPLKKSPISEEATTPTQPPAAPKAGRAATEKVEPQHEGSSSATTTTPQHGAKLNSNKAQAVPANTPHPPMHCGEYQRKGFTLSNVYQLELPGVGKFSAYCEMRDGEGWTVLQRRTGAASGPSFWDASFNAYAEGFGNPQGDYWLGLERVRALNRNNTLQLRVEIRGKLCTSDGVCGRPGDATFWRGDWEFEIADRSDGYQLRRLRYLGGNLSHADNDFFAEGAVGKRFSTATENSNDCGERGGWWHKSCDVSHGFLNGHHGESNSPQYWVTWTPENDGTTYRILPRSTLMMLRVRERSEE